jgi:hypothetical protein
LLSLVVGVLDSGFKMKFFYGQVSADPETARRGAALLGKFQKLGPEAEAALAGLLTHEDVLLREQVG